MLVFILQSAGVVVLLLIGLLIIQLWQVNRNAVAPIREIEGRVRALEEGDLSTDFVAGGSQEFADLAHSINEVAGTLDAQRRSEAEARASLQALNAAYRRFVPQTFISLLHRSDITSVELGDNTELPISILFCDIRSFTPMAESMTARETFDFINAYLARLGPVVREHDGFIDKYIGDEIMALFRSPDDAVAAGVQMFEVLQGFNEDRAPNPPIRIGIHTGQVMLGTIGEQSRMEALTTWSTWPHARGPDEGDRARNAAVRGDGRGRASGAARGPLRRRLRCPGAAPDAGVPGGGRPADVERRPSRSREGRWVHPARPSGRLEPAGEGMCPTRPKHCSRRDWPRASRRTRCSPLRRPCSSHLRAGQPSHSRRPVRMTPSRGWRRTGSRLRSPRPVRLRLRRGLPIPNAL